MCSSDTSCRSFAWTSPHGSDEFDNTCWLSSATEGDEWVEDGATWTYVACGGRRGDVLLGSHITLGGGFHTSQISQ